MELRPLHGGQLPQIVERFGVPASELLDFSANINPDGPPPAVLIALCQALNEPSILTEYPDLEELKLKQALARYVGVSAANVAVANGLVPLLDAALRVLPIRTCLVPVPAFVEYRRVLERSRVEMVTHILAPDSEFSCNTADLFRNSCDAILLANPQNPSGTLFSRDMLQPIVEEAAQRKIYVLLDEAFVDYCPESSFVREIDRFPNLIVFRSVTKFFGMAGLRVAYSAANAGLCMQLQEAIAPWSITSLASLAASVAVGDEGYAQQTITLNNERRDQMQLAIRKLGIHVYPSAANFLLLRLPGFISCQRLWESLIREQHVVLRNCANYEALSDGHLRVAVRSTIENERLIEALAYEVEKKQPLKTKTSLQIAQATAQPH